MTNITVPEESLFSLDSDVLPDGLEVLAFRGREALSTPYWFEIGVSLPHDVDLDMQAALSQRATLRINRGAAEPPMLFHGVMSAITLLQEYENRSIFMLTLAPELWELGLSHHSRIYTDVTIPDIISATLRHSGVTSFELQLVHGYPELEHVCQYRESDLAFLSRLMEREGMYYFFEQGGGREKLIITDDRSAHARSAVGTVRFDPWQASEGREQVAFESFRCTMSVVPRSVRLHDYDYLKPDLAVQGEAAVWSGGRAEVVVYGDNFRTPSEGERLARIQAEALVATQAVYEARGTVYQLQPGFLFQLEQHPRASVNAEYLVTELEHRGKQVESVTELNDMFGLDAERAYVTELRAIPSKVQFRAPRRTPWPRVDGVVDGVVDGDADSPYAQIDEHGRYKMQVFFDESDLVDGSASTWVRMLQPHGGGTEGIHFPLRKGTEVHLVFLGGDPDRPVIVGVAPNAHKPSKVTAANNTKNVIMTGGSNRMELEDADGGQFMNLSTPSLGTFMHMGAGAYNMVQSTNGHGREFVGGNRDGHIVGNATQHVQGAMTGNFDSTVDNTVQGAVTENYNATHSRQVVGPTQKHLMSTLTETVDGAVTRTVNATVGETIQGDVTRTLNSNLEETIQGNVTHTSVGTVTEVHSADKSTTIAGTHHLEAAGAQQIQSLAAQEVMAPTQTFTAEGVQAHNADTHVVSAGTEASVTAPTVIVNADGSVTIQSANVTIVGSDCTMEGGNLTVNHGTVGITSGAVTVDGGGGIDMTAGLIKLN